MISKHEVVYMLGLDISTSSTGWSVLNSEGTLVDMGYIRLDHLEDIFCKAQKASAAIRVLHDEYNFQKVFIEENLQAFRSGFSSARTLVALARFNGIISYESYQITGTIPKFLNVNSARKTVGLKLDRKSDVKTKDQVLEWVKDSVSFDWPTKILKSGPRKGMTILEKGCYDIADAYVISLAGYKLENYS